MAKMMQAVEDEDEDGDGEGKAAAEESEEESAESEQESEESESEDSDSETESQSEEEVDSHLMNCLWVSKNTFISKDAGDNEKKSNLEPRVKRHDGRLSSLKKGNYLLEANVERLKDEIKDIKEKCDSLQADLDSVMDLC